MRRWPSRTSWIELASGQDDEGPLLRAVDAVELPPHGQGSAPKPSVTWPKPSSWRNACAYPLKTWWTMSRTAGLLILRGQLEAAEPAILEAATYGTAHGFDGAGDAAPQLFRLRFDQGRLREYEDAVVDLVEANPEQIGAGRTVLAAIYLQTDRPHLARPHVEFVGADGFRRVPTGGSWLITVAGTGVGLGGDRTAGHRRVGLRILGRLRGTALPDGAVLRASGRPVPRRTWRRPWAGSTMLSTTAWPASTCANGQRHRRSPWYTKEAWAQILIARGGDPHVARRWATEALTTARELGMARLEETSQRTLDLLG